MSGAWLTSRRLRTHGVILCLALWSLYIWTLWTSGLRDRNGNFKGTDFLHFYTLGLVANTHRGDLLYDMDAQASLSVTHVEDAVGIRYLPLYPPQVSLLFRSFAVLPYGWALACWWVCCAILYGACCYLIWRTCPNLREFGSIIFILAAAFPGFFNLIAWGQTSAIALACFTAMFLALRASQTFLGGSRTGMPDLQATIRSGRSDPISRYRCVESRCRRRALFSVANAGRSSLLRLGSCAPVVHHARKCALDSVVA